MNENRIDVHQYQKRLARQKLLLEQTPMREKNRELIRDFIASCSVDPNIREGRIIKCYNILRKIGEFAQKDFLDMGKKDVIQLNRIY